MRSSGTTLKRRIATGRCARRTLLGAALIAAAACSRDARSDTRSDTAAANRAADTALPAGGDVSTGTRATLPPSVRDYEVTDERYRQWVAAQRALDALPDLPPPPRLDTWRVTQGDIDRAVGYLEGQPRAREALARAGLSARDYVLTTVALDQALVVAGGPSRARAAPPRRTVDVAAQHRADLEQIWRDRRFRIAESDTGAVAAPTLPAAARADSAARTAVRRDSLARDSVTRAASARDTATRVAVSASPRAEPTGVIPAGSAMLLQSDQRVCTNTNKVGDRFTATVTDPVPGSDNAVIPAGAKATLTITKLERSKGINDPITVGFDVSSISFGGITYPVEAEVTSAKVNRVRSGKNDAQKVAGGAILGAIAGQVLGRDAQSTVIGAAAGAAAGTAAAAATATYDGCIPTAGAIKIVLQDTVRVRT